MPKDDRPILLSLDGGGAKGWSQLPLISGLVSLVMKGAGTHGEKISIDDSAEEGRVGEEDIYPCDYFDLIVGSGTGGINAILMGRLGMSIKQCRDAWKDLQGVFKVTNMDGGPLFSAEKLEEWAKALVKEHTGNPDSMMLLKDGDNEKPNNNGRSCRVGITSMRAQNIGLPAVFRSYRVRANAGIDCAIWEVLRATTAAPLLFKSVFIGRKWAKQEFINAELGANNPISYLFQEKQKIWIRKDNWPPPEIGCVVSIGSGKDSVISLESESEPTGGVINWAKSYFTERPTEDLSTKLYGVMLRIAKDCERKHQEIESSYGENDEKIYFRFNVEQGMQDVPETVYDDENWERIEAQVKAHINHAEYEEKVEPFIERMLTLLGIQQSENMEDIDQDDPAPAYDTMQDRRIIEKAKGEAKRMGAM